MGQDLAVTITEIKRTGLHKLSIVVPGREPHVVHVDLRNMVATAAAAQNARVVLDLHPSDFEHVMTTIMETKAALPPIEEKAKRKQPAVDPSLDGPEIEVHGDGFDAVTAGIDALVERYSDTLFVRSGRIVHVVAEPAVSAAVPALSIRPLTTEALAEHLWRAARWRKYSAKSKGLVPIEPPHRLVRMIEQRDEWPLPRLDAVAHTPVLRPDGTLADRDGYDPSTATLIRLLGAEFPAIDAKATLDDARAALEYLVEHTVRDLPFVCLDDRAALLSAILVLVARSAIVGPIPAIVVRAATPGTGKTLGAKLPALIATGRPPSVLSLRGTDEEQNKQILALALAGDACAFFDNASGSVGSPVLAGAITSTGWRDRILGQTQMVEAPWKALIVLTGNGLTLRGDLGRRTLIVDLDAEMERPEAREGFRWSPLEDHVLAVRPQLVSAALTILVAHAAAGRPSHGRPRLGSFERWDDVVRSALLWVGAGDPVGTMARTRESGDEELTAIRELFGVWWSLFADQGQTVATIIAKVRAAPDSALSAAVSLHDRKGKTGAPDNRSLGAGFRRIAGRITAIEDDAGNPLSLRLREVGKSHGAGIWRLETVGEIGGIGELSTFPHAGMSDDIPIRQGGSDHPISHISPDEGPDPDDEDIARWSAEEDLP